MSPPKRKRTKRQKLCLVGFGHVGKEFVRLLLAKQAELRERYAIEWRITGLASRRLGWLADAGGLDPEALLAGRIPPLGRGAPANVRQWLRAARADVLFEASSLNWRTGEPATEHIRAALEAGAHAISANKGPVVHAYEELRRLAEVKGRRFLFESTVMDGAPTFSLFRETLPAVHLRSFRGILNSTSNVVLTEMERGLSFEEAVRNAQELGIAETDPSDDLDGWDPAVKVAALVVVLMGVPVKLDEIARAGIRGLDPAGVRAARASGRPFKLVCRARREGSRVVASVAPEQLPLSDPLALVDGTSSCVQFETDVLPGLTIIEQKPGVVTTAYGMLADFVRAVRE